MGRAFSPKSFGTVNISVGALSQSVFVARNNGPISVRIHNAGTAMVWIEAGDSNVAASTANGLPIGPGLYEVLTFAPGQDGKLYIAAIAAGATGDIYFTAGEGL